MNVTLNKSYPIKLWILTSICGPYIGVILNVVYDPQGYEIGMLYGPLLLGLTGAFISLPACIVCYILFGLFALKLKSEVAVKVILCLFSCGVIVLVFLITDLRGMLRPSNKQGFLFFQGIVFAALLSSIVFKPFHNKH